MVSLYERKPCFATCFVSVDHVQIAVNYCQLSRIRLKVQIYTKRERDGSLVLPPTK